MWKNFFYFSRGQRIAIVALIVLVVSTFALNWLLPKLIPTKDGFDPSFTEKAELFRNSLQSLDSIRQLEWQRQYEEQYRTNRKIREKTPVESYTLFNFDPNELDSVGFIRLGLKPWMVSNILKYRNRGGIYREKADFAKVYGLSAEMFTELEPYIIIKEQPKVQTDVTEPDEQTIIVDLNSADTTQLMQIKGIGRGYARSIIRFRNESGGFVSVEQLRDVYGMRPENYERIAPNCTTDISLVQKIKVNTANVDRLRRHPYINFYQAKAIYELRRKKGELKNLDEFKGSNDFPDEWFAKIEPYLSFE